MKCVKAILLAQVAFLLVLGIMPGAIAQASSLDFESVPSQTATIDELYVYKILTTASPANMELEQAPSGMELQNMYLYWTPGRDDIGAHTVVLTATDALGNHATQVFNIEAQLPYAPTIDVVILDPWDGKRIRPIDTVEVKGLVGSDFPQLELMTTIDGKARPSMTIDGNGSWAVKLTDLEPGKWTFTAKAGSPGGQFTNQTTVTFEVVRPEFEMDALAAASSPFLIILSTLSIAALTDAGKYNLSLLFIAPLYSKVAKEKVLDRFSRGKIYQHILENPGETYSTIMQALGISNGNLAYHLRVLEREGLIHSKRNGTFRHFFPKYMALPKKVFLPSPVQQVIIKIVKKYPGISPGNLAKELQITSGAVSYHLNHLRKSGIIKMEKTGISKKCYVKEGPGETA